MKYKQEFTVEEIRNFIVGFDNIGDLMENLTATNIIESQTINTDDLGEAINVWIEHHGSLDLDTPRLEIINFYNSQKTSIDNWDERD